MEKRIKIIKGTVMTLALLILVAASFMWGGIHMCESGNGKIVHGWKCINTQQYIELIGEDDKRLYITPEAYDEMTEKGLTLANYTKQ